METNRIIVGQAFIMSGAKRKRIKRIDYPELYVGAIRKGFVSVLNLQPGEATLISKSNFHYVTNLDQEEYDFIEQVLREGKKVHHRKIENKTGTASERFWIEQEVTNEDFPE